MTVLCRNHPSIGKVEYSFSADESYQESNTVEVKNLYRGPLPIKVKGTDDKGKEWIITLESLRFVWQLPKVNQSSVYNNGQKGAIVEMFGWSYEDIKAECPTLGKMGWMGVKVFPP